MRSSRKFSAAGVVTLLVLAGWIGAEGPYMPPVPPAALTGQEPVTAEAEFGRPGPGALDEPIGEVWAAGTTWYDYQHNGTTGRMITVDGGGFVHVVWMKGANAQQNPRLVYYNVWDPVAQDFVFTDGSQINSSDRAGYVCQAVTPGGFSFPAFHEISGASPRAHGASVIDFMARSGAFTAFQPVWLVEGGTDLELVWPKIARGSDNALHMVTMHNSTSGVYRFFYSRGVPNWDGEFGEDIDWQDVGGAGIEYVLMDSSWCVSPDIGGARGAPRVAVAWTRVRPGGWVFYTNNDVFYKLSEDGGLTWQPTINLTQFALADTHRAFTDVNVLFDHNDVLHIAFTTQNMDEAGQLSYTQKSMLWHWSEQLGEFSAMGEAWHYSAAGGPGSWGLNAQRPSLSVDPANGYVYCSYQKMDTAQVSTAGYFNADAWVTVSTNGGLNWSVGRNVTATTPATLPAPPGQSRHERDITLADRVTQAGGTRYLHLEWELDLDAGAAIQTVPEGTVTNNTVYYQRIPADSIPTAPLMPWYPLHLNDPPPGDVARCCYGDPGAPQCAMVAEVICNILGGAWDTTVTCTTPCPVLTTCGCQDEPNTWCAEGPVAIPDGNQSGVNIVINVPVSYHITDLNVCLDITHPAIEQLVMHLSGADTMQSIYVYDATGANFRCTVLDDEADTPVGQGEAPLEGEFQPHAPLSIFDGDVSPVYWALNIYDDVPGSSGTLNWVCLSFTYDYISGADAERTAVREYALHPAYPNPFNPSTTLRFDVAKAGRVTIDVFNVSGQHVRTLCDREFAAGSHALVFDGKELTSGIYFARIEAGSFVKTVKMGLMK